MIHAGFTRKTKLLLGAGVFFALGGFAVSPARAQTADNSQLFNQIHELQNQVQTLSRAVYQGDKNAASALSAPPASLAAPSGGINPAAVSDFYSQLTSLQNAQQSLTGQVEKLGFQVQQLADQLKRQQADTDQRFQQLTKATSASAAVDNGTAAPPKDAPTASTAAPPVASTAAPPQSKILGTIGKDSAPQALYEDAFADVRSGAYPRAKAKFINFMKKYPNDPLNANAEYWMGEIDYAQGNYKDAARTFAKGYQDYPKSGKAEDSLYKLALSLAKLDRHDDACLSLQQIGKDFPGDTGPLAAKVSAEIKKLNCP